MGDVVVYTAVTAGRDDLKDPEAALPGVDYVCFTDAPLKSRIWNVVLIATGPDARLTARRHKILPHILFPHHHVSIWHDASMSATARVLEAVEALAGAAVGVFRHNKRVCVYEESAASARGGRDHKSTLDRQTARYREIGYPNDNGLYQTGFLVRRHTRENELLNSLWWSEVSMGSVRDQVSFPYALWRTRIVPRVLPGDAQNNGFVRFYDAEHERRFVPVTSSAAGAEV
jgi:hypothetical protein